jgi:hypothetical protein
MSPGETGVGGITVYADKNENGSKDGDEPSGVSDDQGNYAIPSLDNFTTSLVVRCVPKNGWTVVSPASGTWGVNGAAGALNPGRDFGLQANQGRQLTVTTTSPSAGVGEVVQVTVTLTQGDGTTAVEGQDVTLSLSEAAGGNTDKAEIFIPVGLKVQKTNGQGQATFSIRVTKPTAGVGVAPIKITATAVGANPASANLDIDPVTIAFAAVPAPALITLSLTATPPDPRTTQVTVVVSSTRRPATYPNIPVIASGKLIPGGNAFVFGASGDGGNTNQAGQFTFDLAASRVLNGDRFRAWLVSDPASEIGINVNGVP